MKKTKPIIRIFLGLSLLMLFTGVKEYLGYGITTKLIITTCIGIIILIALYITKLIQRDTLITSLKDSLPYFTVLFLLGELAQVEWMVLLLAATIFLADFAGDG